MPTNKLDLNSLDFIKDRFVMNLFTTTDVTITTTVSWNLWIWAAKCYYR